VLIDKEATVVARASVNHEGLNGLVEAKRFKAAAAAAAAAATPPHDVATARSRSR